MRQTTAILLAVAAAMLSPSLALAGGGEGHGGADWLKLILAFVNFTLFVGLLVFFLRKPMKSFFATRRDEIEKRLREAAELKQQASDKYQEYEAKLKALEEEGARILADARAEGEDEKKRILEAAEKMAARVADDAQRRIDAEVRAARIALRKEAVSEAVDAARRILAQQLTADDDQKLVASTVDQVEKMGGSA